MSSLPSGPFILTRAPGKRQGHAEDQHTAYGDVHGYLRGFAWKPFRKDHSSDNQLIGIYISVLARFWQ
jgi:hypothetical protein